MAGKGKKKKPAGNNTNNAKKGKNGERKKTKRAGCGARRGPRAKSARCNVDIFAEAAMENAYVICHNVQDLLKSRGFPWPEAQKKKKKGKK